MSPKIDLRRLSLDNFSPNYPAWLCDPRVNRYLETKSQTLDQVKDYISHMSSSSSDLLFGIFDTETNHHIGNIKISGINKTHRFAELGLLIGEIRYHGKGVGSRAIQLACLIASRDLNLNKLVAGMNAENFGSYKAFIKSGFREVGRYQKHRIIDGNWLDEIIVEKVL